MNALDHIFGNVTEQLADICRPITGCVYCPDCDKIYDEEELKTVTNHYHKSDDLVCPKCGQFEELETL
jgi:ssDNA-binding Zn-finger/Zn-ribbon topoisomerase 1